MSSEYKMDYDEISPIGGDKTVFVEWDEGLQDNFKLCMQTGYHTYYNTWRTSNKDLIASLEKSMSDTIKHSKVLIGVTNKEGAPDKVIWYPFSSFNSNAALYPELNEFNQIQWKITKLRRVGSKEELENNSTGPVYKYPDVVNDKHVLVLLIPDGDPEYVFESNEFEDAFGIFETEYKEKV